MGGEDAMLACAKGHWMNYVNEDLTLVDIQSAMAHATSCAEFVERPPVEVQS